SWPRGTGIQCHRTTAESEPDHISEIRGLHSETFRRDAAVYSEGRNRPAGCRSVRVPSVAAETAGGGQHSAVETVNGEFWGRPPNSPSREDGFAQKIHRGRS